MHLSFLQSNWFRQYPFKDGQGGLDLYGNTLPTDILVGMRLSLPDVSSVVYVKRLTANNGVVGVEIWNDSVLVGAASGLVTTSNTVLPVRINGGAVGSVTIGNPDSCITKQSYSFDNTNGQIEPSVITKVPSPGLAALNVKGAAMTGDITISSNSVNIGSGLYLSLLTPQDVASRKDQQTVSLTCDGHIIGGINKVIPDRTGKINIVAVAPLVITKIDESTYKLTLEDDGHSAIGFSTLCKPLNMPPADTSDVPARDMNDPGLPAVVPEYKSWSQFS